MVHSIECCDVCVLAQICVTGFCFSACMHAVLAVVQSNADHVSYQLVKDLQATHKHYCRTAPWAWSASSAGVRLCLQVQQDIIKSLKLHNAEVLITSFNRPNTHYSVDLIDVLQQQSPALLSMGAAPAAEPMTTFDTAYACLLELLKGMYLHEGMQGVISTANKKGHVAPQLLQQKLNDTQQHLKQQDQQQQQPPSSSIMSQPCAAAIVYVLKRQTVDAIASKLRADGICAMAYHAGLSASARTTALEQWRDGVVPIVVATVAFGMGVDKSNVRLVVHFNLPR